MSSREYPAQIVRWVDGDTVDLIVDAGFRISFRDRFRLVYMDGSPFDAPEMRGVERTMGVAALERARLAAPEGSLVRVKTFKDDSRGKYGRWLAAIFHEGDVAKKIGEA